MNEEKNFFSYLKLLRPHQWLKNLLIFIPMIVGHQFTFESFIINFKMFVVFSLIASSVYILNDILDLKSDRAHPRKRFRPIASGKITISDGKISAFILFVLGSFMAFYIDLKFFLIMIFYFFLSSLYSYTLKKKVVIDICILAILYTIRIIAGGVVLDIYLSVWLLAFSIFFFFSLAAVKRQAELIDMKKRNQLNAKGRGYRVNDLAIVSMSASGAGYISVLILVLYVSSPEVMKLYSKPSALWGICFILLYWLTRFMLITRRGNMDDDPIVYASKDWASYLCLFLILIFAVIGYL